MSKALPHFADELRRDYAELGRKIKSGRATERERIEYGYLTDWVKDFKVTEKHAGWREKFFAPKYEQALDDARKDGLTERHARNRATQAAVKFTAERVGCSERNVRKALRLRKSNTVSDVLKRFS